MLDAVLAAWTVLWIILGLEAEHEVRGLAELSTSVGSAGRAMTNTADAIRALPGVSIVLIPSRRC